MIPRSAISSKASLVRLRWAFPLLALSVTALLGPTGPSIPRALGASAACTTYLRPARVVTGKFAPITAQSNIPGVEPPTIDGQGDIAWNFQALSPPPAPLRIFVYRRVTGRYSRQRLGPEASGGTVGLMGLSTRWLVFALARNGIDGSDWRIIAHSRKTGQERVIARGLPGGPLSAQFSLDGNIVAWAQPGRKTMRLMELNLATGRTRTIDSAPSATNAYDWVKASRGHVVWEWQHRSKAGYETDILEAAESAGRVTRVTNDGKASQPSLSWPWLAYLTQARFGGSGHLALRNLTNGSVRQVRGAQGPDSPQIGGSLVVFRPGGNGVLALYSLGDRRLVILRRSRQITIHGDGLYTPGVADGTVADVGTNARKVNGKWTENEFVIVILRFHSAHPFRQILTCH